MHHQPAILRVVEWVSVSSYTTVSVCFSGGFHGIMVGGILTPSSTALFLHWHRRLVLGLRLLGSETRYHLGFGHWRDSGF